MAVQLVVTVGAAFFGTAACICVVTALDDTVEINEFDMVAVVVAAAAAAAAADDDDGGNENEDDEDEDGAALWLTHTATVVTGDT